MRARWMSCCWADATAGARRKSRLSAELKLFRLPDPAREVEHRARQLDTVFHRAHDGLRGEHSQAERADPFDERQVLAIDDEAVDEAQVLRCHGARRRLL